MPKFYVTASDREYAEKLTKQIRSAADDLWALLLQAWESKAWASLGYKGWNDYVAQEFDFTRRQSYHLINQGRVIRQLREASGENHGSHVSVTEREARDIFPVRDQVAAEVREQVSAGVEPQEAVRVAVERVRAVPVTSGPFNSGFDHIADDDEPSTCVHEYVCRHCGELLA